MRREPHENVATVLVEPAVLFDLELALLGLDLLVWPIRTAPICADGPRTEFQTRLRLVTAQRGAWDDAAHWAAVWIGFGDSWRRGDEPLPWAAHEALWDALAEFGERVRYRKRLGGVPVLPRLGEP